MSYRLSICVVLLMLLGCSIEAQKYFTANGDGESWFDPNNWNPIGVPDQNTDVIIDITIDTVIQINQPGGDAYARSLVIDGVKKLNLSLGTTLHINGMSNVNATTTLELMNSLFTVDGIMYIEGAISDGIKILGTESTLSIQTQGRLIMHNFANNANGAGIEIDAGNNVFQCIGITKIRGGGNHTEDGIVNHGSVWVEPLGILSIRNIHGNNIAYGIENYGDIRNEGYIGVDSIANSTGIIVYGSNAELNNQSLVETTNILGPDRSGVDILDGATVYGNGTFKTHLIHIGSNNSIISPGGFTTTGVMTIDGDFSMDDDAIFQLDIAGDAGPGHAKGHDQLVVNGDIELIQDIIDHPALDVRFQQMFSPEIYRNYAFVKFSGSRIGILETNINNASVTPLEYHIVFRRFCQGNEMNLDCIADCTLPTGLYITNIQIQITGNYAIPTGAEVLFVSPSILLGNGFSSDLGEIFETTIGQCN